MGQRQTLRHLGANQRRSPRKTVQEVRGRKPRQTVENSGPVRFKKRVKREMAGRIRTENDVLFCLAIKVPGERRPVSGSWEGVVE